ncbi:hypothetical protein EXIGLDRAFT_331177 [Exidia glandulosa HHB12029]|uniref:Uncharacterized protein n=1 Tax=Exidia glandulosa HHB12029 TaxID=1314781 RepID=A0A165CRF5_EXIGL|nr:hypothetical protein EXIGLDRAFT_331177 [Exidia glandulosa HHB12029]
MHIDKNALMITGHRVFLAIDNYTSPAIDFSGILRSWICTELWEQFMGPALRDVGSLIWGGLLTGCRGHPFLREPEFEQTTEDLSSIDDYIGFSRDDIVHLGRAALGSELSAAAIGNVSDSSEALISAASATAMISKLMKDKTTNPTVGLPRGFASIPSLISESYSNDAVAFSD